MKDEKKKNYRKTGSSAKCYTPEYRIWCSMKYRCNNPKAKPFYLYGGRGVKVCDRWNESFDDFIGDMGKKPSKRHSLDRIDNNGNYEPKNCRWATPDQQCANRRTSVWFEYNGKRMSKKQLPIHIHLAPKLEEKVKKLEQQVLDLQNSIWRYKRNEQRYKKALFEILGAQLDVGGTDG
jgi:hypothetical protein